MHLEHSGLRDVGWNHVSYLCLQVCTVLLFSVLAQQGGNDAAHGDASPLPVVFATCFAVLLQAGKPNLIRGGSPDSRSI